MCISFALSLSLSLSSGVAVSVTTSGNWIGNFVVAMVTPLLLGSVLKTAGTFYILAGFLFASFLFVLLTLPETKGESLERIDQLFLRPWLERINLFYYLRYMYAYASEVHGLHSQCLDSPVVALVTCYLYYSRAISIM